MRTRRYTGAASVDRTAARATARRIDADIVTEPSGIRRIEVPRAAELVAPRPRAEELSVGVLSGVAGYVDASGFLALFGLLPAHLTGELVMAAASATTRQQPSWLMPMTMLPVFTVSVAGAALVSRCARARGLPPLAPLLALLTVSLAVLCGLGTWLCPMTAAGSSWAVLLCSASAVAAMGVQNTLMREALGSSCPTTVMTGNLTQFIIELLETVQLPGSRAPRMADEIRRRARARLRRVGVALIGFSGGAVCGSWLTYRYGLVSIALPTLVVGWFALAARRANLD